MDFRIDVQPHGIKPRADLCVRHILAHMGLNSDVCTHRPLAQLFDNAPKRVHAFEADVPYHHNIGIRQSIK